VPGKHNLTQVIWCDVGVPGGSTFNLYNDMKRKLIDGGVKPEEIAFIQSYKSAEEKAMLFDQIN
jgi:hypothetical protein